MERAQLDDWCEKGILGLVLSILVFSPLATGSVRPQDFLIVEWLTVAIILLWGVRFCVNPKHRLLWVPVCWPVLAFLLYAIARYFTADVEFLARQELIRVLVYGVLFFAIVNNLHRQETTQIVGLALIFLAMAISFYAVFQFLTDSDYVWSFYKPEGYRKRGSGTFICPNHLAGYLEMILPLAIAFTITGRFGHLMKIFLAYATLVIVTGISVTISRGGWIAAGASIAVLCGWLLRQRDYWKRSLLIAAVLVAIFAGVFLKARISPSRHESFDVARDIEDVRLRLWSPAVAIWQDHRWFGVGPAHFDYRFRQYRPADAQLQARPERVHNDYLNTLVDWGLVGALLVAACWGVFYWQVFAGWKFVQRSQNDLAAKRSNKMAFVLGGAIGLSAILVHSFLDFNMHIPSNAILAVTLMALVSSHYRFATERYWFTVRWPLRVPVLLALLAALAFLGAQSWKRTRECHWMARAEKAKPSSDEQIACWNKAFAAEDQNFEIPYKVGEALRMQSWRGLANYREPAQQAITWFRRAADLNRYDPWAPLRLGMCLDWLGQTNEATPYFKRAAELDFNNHSVLAHVGWHYFQLENYAEAKRWLERSRDLLWDPAQNPIPHAYLAIINERFPGAAPKK
jgi:O-antigen ligase